jgi:hypothetical protein
MSIETQQAPKQQASPPPPAAAPKRSFLRSRLALLLVAALAVGAAVAAVVVFTGGGSDKGSGGTVSGPKDSAFQISYPNSWSPLGKDKVAGLPGHPLAVIRRNDGKGVVIVRREQGTPPANLDKLGTDLGRQLKKRLPDLKLRSSKTVKLRSGNALFTSYIRKKTGTVQSVVVVPAGRKTFTLNTVSRGGADNVAREIGRMILSFNGKP